MLSSRMSKFSVRPGSAVVLRYGTAIILVAVALGIALFLRHDNLPHPFISFSLAAIAITFWSAGTGPGLVALLLSYLALIALFVPGKILGFTSEPYLAFYGIFGAAVGWFSASRRRAERLLTEARDLLEARVAERTRELAQSNEELQGTHAKLRHEKDRLKLLLDLNNSIVSKLDLRDLLRDISANVRRLMQCDAVGVTLPDQETAELKLFALDFPAAKGFLREEMPRTSGSLASKAFSTGEPMTFIIGQDVATIEADFAREGLQSACWLPLISRTRVLGVLGLSRLEDIPFSPDDVSFLMQIASQVAIAVENALSYRQISELTNKLAQEKLYLEDEIRTEANFEDIVGKSQALHRVL
jgi:K+-sensing histidine kinase KdpD